MAQIIPFHGTVYEQAAVGAIREVVAPPYDIIDAAGQKALHDRHPQNIIRLELGIDHPGDDPRQPIYPRRTTRCELDHGGALKRDAQPALYYHTIEYTPPYAPMPRPDERRLRGFLDHRQTGAARLRTDLSARKHEIGRKDRPAEPAQSLQGEFQPHLVALL